MGFITLETDGRALFVPRLYQLALQGAELRKIRVIGIIARGLAKDMLTANDPRLWHVEAALHTSPLMRLSKGLLDGSVLA